MDRLKTSTAIDKVLYLFEKEKGGVGSTGTLVSVAHMLWLRNKPIVFIEASTSQQDVMNAYGGHHDVQVLTLTDSDASDQLIDIIDRAPQGAAILANIPGGRFEEMDQVHQVINFAVGSGYLNANVRIVWTMGLDAASKVTLEAMLDGTPPGPILLNLPAWGGEEHKYVHVDQALRDRIESDGGQIFTTPRMPTHLYDMFRTNEIAIDQIGSTTSSVGNKMALKFWEKIVDDALWDIFQ